MGQIPPATLRNTEKGLAMYYQKNRLRAQFKNTEPTKTDQAAAKSTDINVLVGQFRVGGQVLGHGGVPMYEDFTQLPVGLRDMIEYTRNLRHIRAQLPEQLREMPLDELLALNPQQLRDILTPAPTPTPTPTEPAK